MKIKETIERECCQVKDLRAPQGTPLIGKNPEFTYCIHCGKFFQYDNSDGIETNFTYQSRGYCWEILRSWKVLDDLNQTLCVRVDILEEKLKKFTSQDPGVI